MRSIGTGYSLHINPRTPCYKNGQLVKEIAELFFNDLLLTSQTVLDYETWVMNLDEANQSGIPEWYKLYSARDDYQLPSLMPRHWHNLVIDLEENKELFSMFYK
mgnify:CR=1 FL=1